MVPDFLFDFFRNGMWAIFVLTSLIRSYKYTIDKLIDQLFNPSFPIA